MVHLNGFKIGAMDEENQHTNADDAAEQQLKPTLPTVMFLHGLLGQGRGWRQFALNKGIGSGGPDHHRDIVLMDLRNHGESDWHKSMTYLEMAEDLMRFADAKHLEKLTLIGHNVGAKTAMMAAQMYPERVAGLISLDTAPVSTPAEARKGTRGVID